jgi:hypothetical protein
MEAPDTFVMQRSHAEAAADASIKAYIEESGVEHVAWFYDMETGITYYHDGRQLLLELHPFCAETLSWTLMEHWRANTGRVH